MGSQSILHFTFQSSSLLRCNFGQQSDHEVTNVGGKERRLQPKIKEHPDRLMKEAEEMAITWKFIDSCPSAVEIHHKIHHADL